MKNDYTIRTLERALMLLKSYEETNIEFSLKDFAEKVGLSKSTVFRIAVTLEKHGFLMQTPDNKYGLGYEIARLAAILHDNLDIRKMAKPYMTRLATEIGETVLLTVLEGFRAICIDKVESANILKISGTVGKDLPLYKGAGGKILAAYIDNNVIEKGVPTQSQLFPDSYDVNTIKQEMEKIRGQGYCITSEEVDPGVAAISVPIFAGSSVPAAGLCVAFPQFRLNKSQTEKLAGILVLLSACISKQVEFDWTVMRKVTEDEL